MPEVDFNKFGNTGETPPPAPAEAAAVEGAEPSPETAPTKGELYDSAAEQSLAKISKATQGARTKLSGWFTRVGGAMKRAFGAVVHEGGAANDFVARTSKEVGNKLEGGWSATKDQARNLVDKAKAEHAKNKEAAKTWANQTKEALVNPANKAIVATFEAMLNFVPTDEHLDQQDGEELAVLAREQRVRRESAQKERAQLQGPIDAAKARIEALRQKAGNPPSAAFPSPVGA